MRLLYYKQSNIKLNILKKKKHYNTKRILEMSVRPKRLFIINIKQEILIRNSQVGLSGTQSRKNRQNSLSNRYPTNSYKRSNSQTSKYNKPFKIPSIVERKPKIISNSQLHNSQLSNTQINNSQSNIYNNNEINKLASQNGFRNSNIFNNNEIRNDDNKIDKALNKNSIISSLSNNTSINSTSSNNNSNSTTVIIVVGLIAVIIFLSSFYIFYKNFKE